MDETYYNFYLDLFNSIIEKYGITPKGVVHVGMHKAEEYPMYKHFGIQDILFIEANKQLIEQWTPNDPTCTVVHAAVSDKVEDVEFFISNNDHCSSLLEMQEHLNIYPGYCHIGKVKMTTTTLDNILWGSDYSKWNIMNLDIQGAELQAMQGLTNWDELDVVITEVNFIHMYKGCALIADIDNFLSSKGMTRVITHPYDGWGDAVYIKNKFIK